MYEIEKDFSRIAYKAKAIKAEGRYFKINYSSILTKLIQECGRLCESYASDLFIDWGIIDKKLQEKTLETSVHLFGIREMGNVIIWSQYIFNKSKKCPRSLRESYYKVMFKSFIQKGFLFNFLTSCNIIVTAANYTDNILSFNFVCVES